jgi:uncharacterized protein (TIGR03435 family)
MAGMIRFAIALALALTRCASPQPQSAAFEPAFEVASVRPSLHGPVYAQSDPSRLTINAQSLEVLIEMAYGLREYQYSGPSWLHTARYDIVATTGSPQPRSVQLAMLRTLLAERFKLKLRHESKTMPVYFLVVGRNGPKLKLLDDKTPTPFDMYYTISLSPTPSGATEFRAGGSIGLLCDFLRRIAGRPVIDRTGLEGAFELRLLCAIEGFPGEDSSPSVFEAIQAQMGLKLEAATSVVDIAIVDHVEKPETN